MGDNAGLLLFIAVLAGATLLPGLVVAGVVLLNGDAVGAVLVMLAWLGAVAWWGATSKQVKRTVRSAEMSRRRWGAFVAAALVILLVRWLVGPTSGDAGSVPATLALAAFLIWRGVGALAAMDDTKRSATAGQRRGRPPHGRRTRE